MWLATHGIIASSSQVVPPAFANNYSLEFDGVNDSVEIGNPSNLQLTGAMTLSYWFKGQPSGTNFVYAGFDKLGNSGNRGAGLDLRQGKGIYFFIAENSTSLISIDTQNSYRLEDGNWHHVAGVYIPSTSMKLYLNGVEVASKTTGVPSAQYNSGVNPWSIGKRSAHSNYMDGNIDEVAIWDSAQSINDIYSVSGAIDLSSTNPLGWWRFETGSGTTATDSGSGGNDGTILNGTAYSTDVPPTFNKFSLSFDGVDDRLTFNSLTSSGEFTLSFWFKPTGFNANLESFVMGTTSGSGTFIKLVSSTSLMFKIDGTLVTFTESTNTMSLNQWQNLIFTRDSSNNLTAYLNGSTFGSSSSISQSLSIDTVSNIASFFRYKGGLDELAFWTSDKSSDINSIYSSSGALNLSSLSPVNWYRFEEGSGTTAVDSGSAGDDATLVNGVTYSTDKP